MKSKVWIGIRETDINFVNGMFDGSITLFGSGENGNISMEKLNKRRINHNELNSDIRDFYKKAISDVLSKNPNTEFVLYDAIDGMIFPAEFQKSLIYQNSYELLEFLESKFKTKKFFSDFCNVLPYKIIDNTQISYEKLKKFFNNEHLFVLQKDFSCGGNGTYLLSCNKDFNKLSNDCSYLVTPYKKNSIPINVHIVIYKNDYIIFPASIQIIDLDNGNLEYIGSDYSSFNSLSDKQKGEVYKEARKISTELQKIGYRGIAGIDFILDDDNNCYFMEVNARFQASSSLLNKYLFDHNFPTLHEYHVDAFDNDRLSLTQPAEYADGSMYIYHYSKNNVDKLKWIWNKLKHNDLFLLYDDFLKWNNPIDDGSYVFQMYFSKSITSITFQNYIRVQPNLKISNFLISDSSDKDNIIRIKIQLISRGVSINANVRTSSKYQIGFDVEEFAAVTIKLKNKYWITAPCFCKWNYLSPYEIDINQDNDFILKYYGKELMPIDIMPFDLKSEKTTQNGFKFSDIAYRNPDRLRIYHRNGCALQSKNIGCKFCDVCDTKSAFTLNDIYEVIDNYLGDERVNHYLIGGGSESSSNYCDNIYKIADYIKTNTNKSIYLMSQPINDISILKKLKESGITEIAFNIEMFDRSIANLIMPGKSRNTLEYYFESLIKAVKVWGNTGNVRSIIMLGFDELDSFENGIEILCKNGITPILSLFRPIEETPMGNYISLDEETTLQFYEKARFICDKYGLKLGPDCDDCKNNTIAI